MRISATRVDAGYSTDAVYRFVKPRESRKVFACMGDAGREGSPPLKRPTKPNADGVKVYSLGVFGLKNTLLKRLIHARPGPRYIHLRLPDPKRCNGFDAEYFAQFGAERIERGIQKGSRRVTRHFVQTRKRNEAIDLHAYNTAALYSLGAAVRELMPEWVEAASQEPEAKKPEAGRPPSAPENGEDWASGGGRWGRGWS
jgi:phage terminase large subunit GpA-like protein